MPSPKRLRTVGRFRAMLGLTPLGLTHVLDLEMELKVRTEGFEVTGDDVLGWDINKQYFLDGPEHLRDV